MATLRTRTRWVTWNPDRRVVLLACIQPVGELIVDIDLIELSSGLVGLRRPGPSSIKGDVRATVVRLDLDQRILRVDPRVVVVPVRRLATLEVHPSVDRFVVPLVIDVDVVRVRRVGHNACVVERAVHDAALVAHHLPGLTEVVGSIQALVRIGRLDQSVNPVRHVGRDRKVRLPDQAAGKSLTLVFPGVTTVRRLPDAVFLRRRLHPGDDRPRLTTAHPHTGIDLVRIFGVELEIDRAHGVRGKEHLLPRLAGVPSTVDTSLIAFRPWIPESGDVGHIWIVRVNFDSAELTHLDQAPLLPRRSGIVGVVEAAANDHVRADSVRARPDVHHICVRWGYADRADRACLEVTVRDRTPRGPVVVGLPDATAGSTHVERQGVIRMSGYSRNTSTARRPNVAITEVGEGSLDLRHLLLAFDGHGGHRHRGKGKRKTCCNRRGTGREIRRTTAHDRYSKSNS